MKIISIGTDRKIFEEGSSVRERMIEYGKLFEKLDVIVFSKRSQNLESRIQLSDNVYAYPTNSRSRIFYIWDGIKIAKRIFQDSRFKIQDSVLSVQDPFETGLVGLILKLLYKLPLQVQVHTDFINKYFILHSFLNLIRFPIGLFVLSFADSVRTVSERVAKSVRVLSHNISVLPVYVEKMEVVYRDEQTQGDKTAINFLTVCRLEKEKDLKTAILAFKIVSERFPEATFTIVGEGSERGNLELLAKSLELENKIKFVGWQNGLERFYQDADIYVSTSLYEGYGMSTVEAAFHALPLVLSDAGLARYLFVSGESALVCKQGDVSTFANVMLQLAGDFALRHQMGAKALEQAEKEMITFGEYLQKFKASLSDALVFSGAGNGIFKKNILLRYFVAGITGASAQIGTIFVFTDVFKIWYLYSSILSFVVAIMISFALQKFWTFKDGTTEKIHHQFAKYVLVAIFGLILNTIFMFTIVDFVGIWYIFAQVIAGAIIAIINFIMYKFFIFNK